MSTNPAVPPSGSASLIFGQPRGPAIGRRLPRSSERGAALLVVVLVVTLLSAVGLFAMHSASLVNSSSGFNRQASQTMFLAEFAARSAAAAITLTPSSLVNELDAQLKTGGVIPNCKGTAPMLGTVPCVVYDNAYIFDHLTDNTINAQNRLVGEAGIAGALDPQLGATHVRADFHVEVFSLGPSGSWTAGNPINDNSHRVTIQAEARVRPVGSNETANACSPESAPATAVQMLRAHLIFVEEGT